MVVKLISMAGEAANSSSDSSEDEGVFPSSYSDDDASDGAEGLFIRESSKDLHKPKILSNQNAVKPQAQSFLPGGYNPRHREPSYRYVSCHLFLASGILYGYTAYI